MHLELAERLRCPAPHASTPLVVVARRKRDRELLDGFAGCPVCRLEAGIVDGHLRFPPASGPSPDGPSSAGVEPWIPALDRTIALLGLSEPGGAVLLTGRYSLLADAIGEAVDVPVVVMNGLGSPVASDRLAAVTGELRSIPFTDGTFRAAAIDDATAPELLQDAVRTVAVGGRLLCHAALPLPGGLKELARDDREWVAAREAVGGIVELRRRL